LTSIVDAVVVSGPISAPASAPVPAVEEAERPRKKPKIAKEYVPGVGTANYAFIIILYQVQITLHPIFLFDMCEIRGLGTSRQKAAELIWRT